MSSEGSINIWSSYKYPFLACQIQAIGLASSDAIPDNSFSASTHRSGNEASKGRLNGNGAWSPSGNSDDNDYLQIDLKDQFFICAVATQGSSANHWTKKYKLRYSLDNSTWFTYQENDTDKVCLDTRKLATQLELPNGPFPSCSKALYQSAVDMKITISWEYSFSQEILVLKTGNSENWKPGQQRTCFLSVTHQSYSDPLEKNLCKQPSTPLEIVSFSGAPNENIVQNHLNTAFFKVF